MFVISLAVAVADDVKKRLFVDADDDFKNGNLFHPK